MKLSKTRAAVLFASLLSIAAPVFARPSLVIVLVIDGSSPRFDYSGYCAESRPAEDGGCLLQSRALGLSHSHARKLHQHLLGRVAFETWNCGQFALYSQNLAEAFEHGRLLSLLKLGDLNGGRVIPLTTLGEELERNGIRYVALGSGSTGAALLLNHLAPSGKGSLINPGFENGKRVAFPDALNTEILRRVPPVKELNEDTGLVWTERVLREYV